MSVALDEAVSAGFQWKRWPETEEMVDRWIRRALGDHAFAADLAVRMIREAGTPMKVWVDHLVLAGTRALAGTLAGAGYQRQSQSYSVGVPVYAHSGGIFPRVALVPSTDACDDDGLAAVQRLAIKVESVAAFSRAHDLGLEIQGYPLGPYRSALLPGERTDLLIVERRGYLGFEPFPGELAREGRMSPQAAPTPWPRATSG